jgi:hypothetical protein
VKKNCSFICVVLCVSYHSQFFQHVLINFTEQKKERKRTIFSMFYPYSYLFVSEVKWNKKKETKASNIMFRRNLISAQKNVFQDLLQVEKRKCILHSLVEAVSQEGNCPRLCLCQKHECNETKRNRRKQ